MDKDLWEQNFRTHKIAVLLLKELKYDREEKKNIELRGK